ncbi:MAG: type II 3-dehydroquinate dehydratase [Pantoea sp. Brub]|nr:type II 3-dehydroquinate dehydratase [Pantoea sp. Brub]
MKYKFHILILNGPNLNLLGLRETENYGLTTLNEIIENIINNTKKLDTKISHLQSNSESEMINCIHKAKNNVDYIIINPAAFTHTSIAIRDALLAIKVPFIEVHLSNIHSRESFRHKSYFSDISNGVICGFGADGYLWAVQTAIKRISKNY